MENLQELLQNIIQKTEDSELLSSKEVIDHMIEQLQQ